MKINDYNKLIRRIKLYKSFIYRNTIFETDNKDLKVFVKYLNIKDRRKRIEYIYYEIIKEIDRKSDELICDFKDGKCRLQRLNNSKNCNGCCCVCKLVTDKGCSTKNISCKLFYCNYAKKNFNILKMKDIDLFKLLSLRQKLILQFDFFSTSEQVIDDLCSHSLIIRMFKIMKRGK